MRKLFSHAVGHCAFWTREVEDMKPRISSPCFSQEHVGEMIRATTHGGKPIHSSYRLSTRERDRRYATKNRRCLLSSAYSTHAYLVGDEVFYQWIVRERTVFEAKYGT